MFCNGLFWDSNKAKGDFYATENLVSWTSLLLWGARFIYLPEKQGEPALFTEVIGPCYPRLGTFHANEVLYLGIKFCEVVSLNER